MGPLLVSQPRYSYIRVGIYDDKVMPAAMLFGNKEKTGKCDRGAARFFYEPKYGAAAGEYNQLDIYAQ